MISLLFSLIALTIALTRGHNEPVYQGKRLSYWLGHFEPLPTPPTPRKLVTPSNDANVKRYVSNLERRDRNRKIGTAAIREIGTNCIPFLKKE